MGKDFLKSFSNLNIRNFIIVTILLVWGVANIKSLITNVELSESAKDTVNGLRDIMLLVLGYYLKKEDDNLLK